MKRSTKLAFSLVLAMGMVLPAIAQENFPDVPANHWAYEALARMKADGLLVGYPDGLYRGSRPASRYELAVAMNAVYSHLKSLIDGLQNQLNAVGSANPQDIANLKDQIAHLQDEINAMKGWGDDIAALKRATEEFDKELRSLGVDVDAMKKELGDLSSRVAALEKRKPAVDISGDVNFFAVTTNSSHNHQFGIDQDGKLEGWSGAAPIGLGRDLAFLHEAAFHVAGTNETGPKWQGTFVVGNMMGAAGFGSQSTFAPSSPGSGSLYSYAQGLEDVYIQDLSARFDVNVIGLAFNAEAGRVAYKLSPYMFQRPNTESYFENERWNDGRYRMDGAILGFNFGPAKIHIWGGNTSNLLSVQGSDLNPMVIANSRIIDGPSEGSFGTNGVPVDLAANGIIGTVDQTAAADLSIGLGQNGHLNLAYMMLDQNGRATGNVDNLMASGAANRDQVYGGDANFGFGPLKIEGGYHKSELSANWAAVNSHDNAAWNVQAKLTGSRYNLWGGYREIDNNYYAPGDWGRLAIIQNPGNIKGWQAGGYLDVTRVIRLTATGEWDKGEQTESQASFFNSSPFSTATNIRQLMARLDLRFNPNFSVYGAWQDTSFSTMDTTFANFGGADHANFDWTTIGLGYGLSANAKFNLAYQFSNAGIVDGVGGLVVGPGGVPARYNGGILTSQLTIKF